MTWGELRQILVQGAGSGLPLSTITHALNLALNTVQTDSGWPRSEKQFELPIAGPVIAGTVAVTNGSATVTGTGTDWTAAMNGRRFRLTTDDHFYTIAVSSSTSLTLNRAYEGTTGTGKAYRISDWFVRAQELSSTIRSITSSRGGSMEAVSGDLINEWDPFRQRSAPYPSHWFPLGDSTDRAPQALELLQIGFWPEVSIAQSLNVIAPERVIGCSDDSLDVQLPAWIHDAAILHAAVLKLATIAPRLADGSPRVPQLDYEMSQYNAAIQGMRMEADRQPIRRNFRRPLYSENPCALID